jgi:hypothetical protein
MRLVRLCLGRAKLDLNTLVWTRGAAFPISQLDSRLKCPLCGSRRVALIFRCYASNAYEGAAVAIFHAGHVGIIKSLLLARATGLCPARMATLTATGFPQLFCNERQREK